MNARHRATALAFVLALARAADAAGGQQTPQPVPQRRPQGPAAGPVIKLPPGAGATEERTQTPGAREETAPALPQKWEYCVINGFRYHSTGFGSSARRVVVTHVRYLPEGSEEFEGSTEDEAVNNALARLGEDGWELTAIRTDLKLDDGDGATTAAYFLKRPKRQD
jgi:hypothetical protein